MSPFLDALDAHASWDDADLAKMQTPPVGATHNADADPILAQYFAIMVKEHPSRRLDRITKWIRHQEHAIDALHLRPAIDLVAARNAHAKILGRLTNWQVELVRAEPDAHGQAVIEGRMAS